MSQTASERHRNAPLRPSVASALVRRVREVAAERREARAVSGANTSMTYGELDDRLMVWSDDLRRHGGRPGTVVALGVVDPAYLAPAYLAARAAGLVPLMMDPHQPAERRDQVLRAARPALTMRVQDTPEYLPTEFDPRTLPEAAGYVGFTSGTQGPPKGIVSQEAGVLHFLEWERQLLGLEPGQRVAMISPPTFEVIFRELGLALCGGGELVVAPAVTRVDPAAVVPWLADHDVDVVHVVPSLAARWAAAARHRRADRLRWTLFAGEPLHSHHVEVWRAVAPHARVINLYGPSETTLAKFWYAVPPNPTPGPQPAGRPLPQTRLRQLPLRSADEPGGGASFQVAIETPYGSLGYLDGTATEADHAALRRTAGLTTFTSQDIGELDERGNLVIKGRMDSQVKRRGVFVDLAAIEQAAIAQPSVRLACCFQLAPDAGGTVVLALETDGELPLAELRQHLRRQLGPQSPDEFRLVERIPLNPNGKIDRRELLGRLTGSGRQEERTATH
ncbi:MULTISPECIES: AMP-binding protein [Streptomyces]|uniref:Amino acid adenylation protein n=1 Tax=Streptomyces canarius TaxID=285453 RepID=A0ABQ3CSK2_9ACTN|nr:AMP-binding protein [Streptomyces canarius]GHA33962.1 amino acid adenylation protein [Streptomyces canarius]